MHTYGVRVEALAVAPRAGTRVVQLLPLGYTEH
jgi:hypothetical protein